MRYCAKTELKIKYLAEKCGVTERTARRWFDECKIPAYARFILERKDSLLDILILTHRSISANDSATELRNKAVRCMLNSIELGCEKNIPQQLFDITEKLSEEIERAKVVLNLLEVHISCHDENTAFHVAEIIKAREDLSMFPAYCSPLEE